MLRKKPGRIIAALVLISALSTGAALGIAQAVGGDRESNGNTQDEVIAPFTPIDRMELVAKEVPGFGGLFTDRNPDGSFTVYVYMMDENNRAGAEKAARARLGDMESVSELKVLKANYPFTDIAEWYRQLKRHLWAAVDEITRSGIGYDTNQIRIYLSDLSAEDKLRQVFEELGIPVDAVLIQHGDPWILLSEDDLQAEWRPVVGGVQIQTGGAQG
ncbi:MAG: hypothetical protein WD208_11010 [Dehalococcoidia bacterium]